MEREVIYLPGLGADARLFYALEKGVSGHHFSWPEHRDCSNLQEFAKKCIQDWNLKAPFTIIGFSFGGILGKEIIKNFPNEEAKLLMISSCRGDHAITLQFKLLSHLIHFLPDFLLRFLLVKVGPYFAKRADSKLKDLDFNLLQEMAKDIDLSFFRWSVVQCRQWSEGHKNQLANIKQIHGQYDSVIPYPVKDPDKIISGAHHLICYTHPTEIINFYRESFQ